MFEAVLRLEPGQPRAVFNLGTLYAAQGDYQKAVPLLEQASGWPAKPGVASTSDIALLSTLLNVYAHAGRNREANALADSIEQLANDDARKLFTLALSLADGREYERAIRVFERVNALHPRTFEVLYNLGIALYNLDRFDEATRVLTEATQIAPNEPEPFYRLGLIASVRGDGQAAANYWSKALELRPNFAEANFMLGEELLKARQPGRAVPFYERAVAQDSKLLYYIRLGVANFRAQHYAKARETFNAGLVRFPDNANLYFLLGYVARAEGQYDDAVTAFKRALQMQPDNPDLLGNLGYIASQRGENVEAERLLRRAIALDPNAFPPHHDLGRLLVKLKKYDEALPVLQRGAGLNKQDPGVHYQLFLAYSRLRRTADADKELALFKELDEANRHGNTALGMATKTGADGAPEILPPIPSVMAGEARKP
jgi:tetratricopeptide (TPR) repeat protein